jgi:hypothetical protein
MIRVIRSFSPSPTRKSSKIRPPDRRRAADRTEVQAREVGAGDALVGAGLHFEPIRVRRADKVEVGVERLRDKATERELPCAGREADREACVRAGEARTGRAKRGGVGHDVADGGAAGVVDASRDDARGIAEARRLGVRTARVREVERVAPVQPVCIPASANACSVYAPPV